VWDFRPAVYLKQHEEIVKLKLRSGIVCSCLILLAQASLMDAEQQPPPAQQQPPPAQQPPPPPPQQPPPTPPTAPATPQTPKPVVTREPSPQPAPQPAVTPERDTGGDAYSIEPLYWLTKAHPLLRNGVAAPTTLPGTLDFPGHSKYGLGIVITVPTSHENSLQFTGWRVQGTGNTILGQESLFNSNNFAPGYPLNTNYKIQDLKLSWNYLTYPYPSNGAKLRVLALFEVQYLSVSTNLDAPLDPNATPTGITKSIILPTLGIGIEYHPSKHTRLELKGSGFVIPHHADIWDAEASVVVRVKRIEAFVGGKAFHFKTSPQADEYFSETLFGPYAGIRYLWK
jgi:hypothetical protein